MLISPVSARGLLSVLLYGHQKAPRNERKTNRKHTRPEMPFYEYIASTSYRACQYDCNIGCGAHLSSGRPAPSALLNVAISLARPWPIEGTRLSIHGSCQIQIFVMNQRPVEDVEEVEDWRMAARQALPSRILPRCASRDASSCPRTTARAVRPCSCRPTPLFVGSYL